MAYRALKKFAVGQQLFRVDKTLDGVRESQCENCVRVGLAEKFDPEQEQAKAAKRDAKDKAEAEERAKATKPEVKATRKRR